MAAVRRTATVTVGGMHAPARGPGFAALATLVAGLTVLGGCVSTTVPAARPTPLRTPRGPAPSVALPQIDPRCDAFLSTDQLATALGTAVEGIAAVEVGLVPPPLIELRCTWRLAGGAAINLAVDDAIWDGEHRLATDAARIADATPIDDLGDVALATEDAGTAAVRWAIRHGGADRTLALDAELPTADLVALARLVTDDASPDLWTAPLPPTRRAQEA